MGVRDRPSTRTPAASGAPGAQVSPYCLAAGRPTVRRADLRRPTSSKPRTARSSAATASSSTPNEDISLSPDCRSAALIARMAGPPGPPDPPPAGDAAGVSAAWRRRVLRASLRRRSPGCVEWAGLIPAPNSCAPDAVDAPPACSVPVEPWSRASASGIAYSVPAGVFGLTCTAATAADGAKRADRRSAAPISSLSHARITSGRMRVSLPTGAPVRK